MPVKAKKTTAGKKGKKGEEACCQENCEEVSCQKVSRQEGSQKTQAGQAEASKKIIEKNCQ